jgi:alpha-beta hydrolase superfamily lysophospholipase
MLHRAVMTQSPPAPVVAPTVVLIHGMGRTRRAMRPLERAARERGYRVLNVGYPSRRGDAATHARTVAATIRREAPDGPLYVVTHSLGGILLRQAVATGELPASRVARAVMLAPPNQGSELADAFWHLRGLRWLGPLVLGPAGADLRTDSAALVHRLPPVTFEVGVIAGTRSVNPLLSWIVAGPDDSKVSVRRTAVAGMRASIAMPHSHPFIMAAPDVVAQAFAFLETGRFAAGHR